MMPRFVRLALSVVIALSASSGSATAFAPSAGFAAAERSRIADAPTAQVHDRWFHGHEGRSLAPPVVVVTPQYHLGDGLCVTRQPVTSISCYRLLREQQQQLHYMQHYHEHGPGCGHTPRYAHRHGALVFLGWF